MRRDRTGASGGTRQLPGRVIGVGVEIQANFLAYYRRRSPVEQIQKPSILFLQVSGGTDKASAEQETFSGNNIQ